ncbi:protein of unknown function [Candidatus Methylocalor cossyra]|uniref:Uncharacterized protein n=1 Tax=Candidatus Methylocalor cossyra TaxID=3108543 RepID=A0ABM9NJU8_9GAMM
MKHSLQVLAARAGEGPPLCRACGREPTNGLDEGMPSLSRLRGRVAIPVMATPLPALPGRMP